MCPRLPKPMTSIFWDIKLLSTQFRKEPESVWKHMIVGNRTFSKIGTFEHVGHDGREGRTILKIRLINSWKSWIWEQYLATNMKWICESLKLWKRWKLIHFSNFEVWNLGTLLFSIKGVPSTAQHTDSHPCTSPAPGGHEWSWGTPVISGMWRLRFW